jgi:hypothetical protein
MIDSGNVDRAAPAAHQLGVLLTGQGDIDGARAAFQPAIDFRRAPYSDLASRNLRVLLENASDLTGIRFERRQVGPWVLRDGELLLLETMTGQSRVTITTQRIRVGDVAIDFDEVTTYDYDISGDEQQSFTFVLNSRAGTRIKLQAIVSPRQNTDLCDQLAAVIRLEIEPRRAQRIVAHLRSGGRHTINDDRGRPVLELSRDGFLLAPRAALLRRGRASNPVDCTWQDFVACSCRYYRRPLKRVTVTARDRRGATFKRGIRGPFNYLVALMPMCRKEFGEPG